MPIIMTMLNVYCIFRLKPAFFLSVVIISAGLAIAKSALPELPVRVHANIYDKDGEQWLRVSILNQTCIEIAISTDFLRTSRWAIDELEEDFTDNSFQLRQLVPIEESYISEQTFKSRLNWVKNKLDDPLNSTKLSPGKSFSVEIPLKQVLEIAKLSNPKLPILAQLNFKNLAVGGSGISPEESVELFLTRFTTPRYELRNGMWKPFLSNQ